MCFSGVILTAQEKIMYSGKIIDAETRQPIELVAVYTDSSSTISNMDGEYELKSSANRNIMFSHISYHAQTIHCQSVPDVIELKPKTFELAEVVIMPQEAIIRELKGVWSRYSKLLKGKKEKDFPVSTYYYRQLTFNNDTCVEYIESFFTAPTLAQIRTLSLQEGRYARIKRDSIFWFANYFTNSLAAPFSISEARTKAINSPLCADFEKYYNVSIHKIISSGQQDEIRVYAFQPKEDKLIKNSFFISGLLYIRMEDRTILRAEMNANSLGFGSSNISILNEGYTFVVSYRDVPGSCPTIASVQVKCAIDANIHDRKCNMKIQSILIPAEYTFTKKGNRLKQKDVLFHEVMKSNYNQAFWDENPVVKRTKVEQQVLDDFNREGYFGTLNLESN